MGSSTGPPSGLPREAPVSRRCPRPSTGLPRCCGTSGAQVRAEPGGGSSGTAAASPALTPRRLHRPPATELPFRRQGVREIEAKPAPSQPVWENLDKRRVGWGGKNPLTSDPARPAAPSPRPSPLTAFILAVHVPGHLVRQRHASVQRPPPAAPHRRGARGGAEHRLGRGLGLLRLAAPAACAAPAPALGAPRRPRGLRGHVPAVGGWRRRAGGGRALAAAAAGPQRALRTRARAERAHDSITPHRAARPPHGGAATAAAPPRPRRGSASAARPSPSRGGIAAVVTVTVDVVGPRGARLREKAWPGSAGSADAGESSRAWRNRRTGPEPQSDRGPQPRGHPQPNRQPSLPRQRRQTGAVGGQGWFPSADSR